MFAGTELIKLLDTQTRGFYAEVAAAVERVGISDHPSFFASSTSAALFAGEGSPLTQATGTFEEFDLAAIDELFGGRATSWEAVLSPFSGAEAMQRLLDAGARVEGWESVLYRQVTPDLAIDPNPSIEVIEVDEGNLEV